MSKDRAIAHDFEGEQLESVFVGRRDAQARPTVMLIPTVMGVSDLEIGFGRQLVELGYNAFVADLFGKKFRGEWTLPAAALLLPRRSRFTVYSTRPASRRRKSRPKWSRSTAGTIRWSRRTKSSRLARS